ncbi:MAG: hypothetical protein HWD58_07430 [Bacteroidota bacterium]|nr:MAG: hypothetical protein HWD58_07430 [Bacteroidota bacterium]
MATPISISGPVNAAQCGFSNGSLDLTASGGVGPYTFSIDGNTAQPGGLFTNLAPGMHTITVMDANACPATSTYQIIAAADVTAPTAICKPLTVYLDHNGFANIQPSDIDNGSNDDCNLVTYQISMSSFDCSHIGFNGVFNGNRCQQ